MPTPMPNHVRLAMKRHARSQKRAENIKHPWYVGELCTAVYDNMGEGIIYRVTGVSRVSAAPTSGVAPLLKLAPVYGVLSDVSRRKPRTLDAGYCTPMSIVDLASEYSNFGLFIAEEARRRGTDEETNTEALPTWDDASDEERIESGDGSGLLVSGGGTQQIRP